MPIAEIQHLPQIPRTAEFEAELNDALFTLIPATMARACDPKTPEIRDPALLCTSHLHAHATRLLQALETGEHDNLQTAAALEGFWLMREAAMFWRDQHVRWPALTGEADEVPAA
jgi:hypothetical protein